MLLQMMVAGVWGAFVVWGIQAKAAARLRFSILEPEYQLTGGPIMNQFIEGDTVRLASGPYIGLLWGDRVRESLREGLSRGRRVQELLLPWLP